MLASVRKRDGIPLAAFLAAALMKRRVHRGDSDRDSRGDGYLLSSLTPVASFLIHKCKQTGAKSFLFFFSLHCTVRLSPEMSPCNVLSPPCQSYFCVSWHFCRDLIYLFIFPSPLLRCTWALGRGLGGAVLELSAGAVGIGDPLLTSDIAFFPAGCCLASLFRVAFWTRAFKKLVPVDLCFGGQSLLLLSSCLGGSYGHRVALRKVLLWKQVCLRLPRALVP